MTSLKKWWKSKSHHLHALLLFKNWREEKQWRACRKWYVLNLRHTQKKGFRQKIGVLRSEFGSFPFPLFSSIVTHMIDIHDSIREEGRLLILLLSRKTVAAKPMLFSSNIQSMVWFELWIVRTKANDNTVFIRYDLSYQIMIVDNLQSCPCWWHYWRSLAFYEHLQSCWKQTKEFEFDWFCCPSGFVIRLFLKASNAHCHNNRQPADRSTRKSSISIWSRSFLPEDSPWHFHRCHLSLMNTTYDTHFSSVKVLGLELLLITSPLSPHKSFIPYIVLTSSNRFLSGLNRFCWIVCPSMFYRVWHVSETSAG